MRGKPAENSDLKVSSANSFHRVSSPHLPCTMIVYKFVMTVFLPSYPIFFSTVRSSELSGANLFHWKAIKCYKAGTKWEPAVTMICETLYKRESRGSEASPPTHTHLYGTGIYRVWINRNPILTMNEACDKVDFLLFSLINLHLLHWEVSAEAIDCQPK